MALIPQITRHEIHEYIVNNNTIHCLNEKKNVLNYVLNILKIDPRDDELQNKIANITKCLNSSFFNR